MKEYIYPCPSCGFLVFDEPSGSYDICPICGWEDDNVQLKYPLMRGGANGGSLLDYQKDILKELPVEITKTDEYIRSSEWHPLRQEDCIEDADVPKSGMSYFLSASKDALDYYWKKKNKKD